ncbi:TIGR02587 family membrane protein [Virgifigura deserti]|uniref:TIGR02587 family membrane protein n=1 Tax=Virgifigura deserti TaxID=2268457 RepID=UPI003CCC228A
MLMTMEMWQLGFYMDPLRLILLLVLLLPLLAGLGYYSGFKETSGLRDEIVDAFVAFAVGSIASAIILAIFGIVTPEMSPDELIGKIALQAIPASIGAMLARSQLSGQQNNDAQSKQEDREQKERKEKSSYAGEIFLMAVGALFLSLNVAPTEEMILIAYTMATWQEIALVLLSLALMHAFVYAVDFRGRPEPPDTATFWSLFLRFTVVGYAIVLIISLYILWSFGRTTGTALEEILSTTVVLGFPGAIGAAAARLLL